MRQGRRAGIAAGVAALLFWSTSGIALAHARLVRSNPAPDALLRKSPTHIDLWFSEDLNGAASRIIIWDRYRHPVTSGGATLIGPREMEIGLKPLRPGSYLVLWTSVSSQDGHVLHGSYLFSVKIRGPGPSLAGVTTGSEQAFPDAVGLLALLSHWIELLAAVTWAGSAIFSAVILGRLTGQIGPESVQSEYRRTRRLMRLSLLLLLAASTGVLLSNAYGIAGNDWGSVLSHSTLVGLFADQYGQVWIARQVVVVIALVFTARYRARGITALRSEAVGAQTVFAVLYLYALAASGHDASTNIGALPGHHGSLFSVAVAADWLHLLADAVWFGGQIYIVLVLIPVLLLRRKGTHWPVFLAALDRFTPAAYASIAGYAVSGVFSAKVLIPSWYAFFYSIYGRTLLVKMSLIGLMMLVSAYTVYLVRPRLRHALAANGGEALEDHPLMGRLLDWLRINPVLGAGVLLATSVLFYYPVPAGFGPSGPSVYVAHAAGLTAALSIKPDRSGPNQITVVLHDRQGRPVQQAHVTVLTTMLDMVMGTGVASFTERSPGRFVGSTDLGMGGHWRLQVLVYQPSGLTRMSVKVQVAT